MTLKAVFFDLDGTLLDTAPDLGGALNALLKEEQKESIPITELRHVVSDGARGLLKLGFDIDDSHETYAERRGKLLNYYLQNIAKETQAFEGIDALITKLSENSIKWGIATNKPWLYTEALMQHFSFVSDPSCILCPEHVTKSKPDPASLYKACELAGCEVNEGMFIGDHKRDIECGQNAGMKTIAAAYGYVANREDCQDWQANYCVEHAGDIWPIIQDQLT